MTRKPGDPIPADVLRQLRLDSGLTQDQFAERLGVRGGKGTVSAWESGRSKCAGPVAELALLLFGRDGSQLLLQPLRTKVREVWERGPNPTTPWRQLAVSPVNELELGMATFADLFPVAALTEEETQHGFPYQQINGRQVAVRDGDYWLGSVPLEPDSDPQYLWAMDRRTCFLRRENRWELDAFSVTEGHVHLGWLLMESLKMTHFLQRAYVQLQLESDIAIVIRLEMTGVHNQGVVGYRIPAHGILTRPSGTWDEDAVSGRLRTTVQAVQEDPINVALDLVSETVGRLEPEFGRRRELRRQLGFQHQHDLNDFGGQRLRHLTFIDGVLG